MRNRETITSADVGELPASILASPPPPTPGAVLDRDDLRAEIHAAVEAALQAMPPPPPAPVALPPAVLAAFASIAASFGHLASAMPGLAQRLQMTQREIEAHVEAMKGGG